jgi:hypothetical protein
VDQCVISTRTNSQLTTRNLVAELKPYNEAASARNVNFFTIKELESNGFEAFRAIARVFRESERNKALRGYL